MSLAHAIAPHLPYLRRYARALTGSQADGDSYVRSCLEALVDNPNRIRRDISPRVALYAVFHQIWPRPGHITAGEDSAAAPSGGLAESLISERLSALTPTERQALLLTTMEGFSDDEAAQILGIGPERVRGMVQQAIDDMTAHPATSVLIVEDEPVISMDLSHIIEDMGHRVQAVAVTRDDALAAVRQSWPGLVLADIQLADGSSGVDAVNDMLRHRPVPVIFITAYPERLLTGERPEPTFLVTKPFAPEAVKAAVSQALFLTSAEPAT